MTRTLFRVGDVLRSNDPLDPYFRVDPERAQSDDRVVFEARANGFFVHVSVRGFREWLDWRIGADL